MDSPIDCIAESLNAIYDIYADKDFDYDEPVFVREGYLHVLESIVDSVQKTVGFFSVKCNLLFIENLYMYTRCLYMDYIILIKNFWILKIF